VIISRADECTAKEISQDEIILPEPDIRAEFLCAYEDPETGVHKVHAIKLKGEDAGHLPTVIESFLSWLRASGFQIDHYLDEIEPPVTVRKIVRKLAEVACVTIFACTLSLDAQRPRLSTAPRQYRLAVSNALIPLPTRAA
jgi:hypothetical protein